MGLFLLMGLAACEIANACCFECQVNSFHAPTYRSIASQIRQSVAATQLLPVTISAIKSRSIAAKAGGSNIRRQIRAWRVAPIVVRTRACLPPL